MAGPLTLALRITADGSQFRAEIAADEASLRKLNAAATSASDEARRAGLGFGAYETAIRQAASSNVTFSNETQQLSAAIDDYGSKVDGARERLNPYVALQRDYRARQAEINEAVKMGGIAEIEGTRLRDLSTAAYKRNLNGLRAATAATREHTGAVKLQGWQLGNLFQQFQDVGVQAAMGTNPFIILAQQGPQITSAMGGVKNTLALVAPYFTATTVAMGALTAGVIAGALAWNSYLNSIKAVQAAAAGRGRGLGISPGDLEEIAHSGAEAAGISVKTARQAEIAFLNTGKIGKKVMIDLIGVSRDWAATIGTDVAGAFDDLQKNFADPVKGAQEYQKSLVLLDDRTKRYIETLGLQNRTLEAQIVLFDAVNKRKASADESKTASQRFAERFSNVFSNFGDQFGQAINDLFDDPAVSQSYLDGLEKLRASAMKNGGRAVLLKGLGMIDMDELGKEIARVQAALGKLRQDEATKRINLFSTRAGEAARSLTPGQSELDGLRARQSDLRAALHDPQIAAGVDSIVQVANAYDRVTHAIDSYITPAQRAVEADRLATQALTARTPAEKAAVAAAQKRLELQGQTQTASERETQVLSAGNLARAQATQSIIDENRALALNARSTLDVAAAWGRGSAAAMIAEAQRQALSEAINSGVDVETRAQLHLRDAIAARAEQGAAAASDMDEQAASQRRINDAVAAGTLSLAQANAQLQLDATLRPLVAAAAIAEGDAKQRLLGIINQLRAAQNRLSVEQARAAAVSTIAGQNDQLEMLRRETSLIGANAEVRAISLARLAAEQQMRRDNIPVQSEEGQKILANTEALARQALVTDRQSDAFDRMRGLAENAFDAVGDNLAEGKVNWDDWADVATDALQSVLKELNRLIITAPAMNALFGTNYSTIADVGGLVGSFFGGGFAKGGAAQPNKVILVGEEGPELINTGSRGVYVTPLDTGASARSAAISGSGGFGGVTINNNIRTAPGTRATTTTRNDGNGQITLDTIVEAVEDRAAARGRNGQGRLFPALAAQYGLSDAARRNGR